jgi:tetratricopeptide (TPR) repeat protein
MLRTSVLPELTVEICNALLETANAQACIDELVKRDLFIAQIGTGFRYHDLFAEFLRSKLAKDTAMYCQVSLQAAKFLAAQARFEEAANLYLSVQAWDDAASLLETHGKFFYDTGRALTLHHWLGQMPEPELTKRPRLLLMRGQILNNDLGEPQEAMALYKQAEDQFRHKGDFIGAAEAQVWRASALRMVGRAKEGSLLIANGLDQLSASKADKRLIAWATRHHGLVHLALGNTAAALLDLRGALSLFETLNDTYNVGLCHHDLGFCLEKQGSIGGAEHHYRQALRIWETLGNANDLANTLNSLGVCCYLRGDYTEALKQFQESLDIALQIGATRRAAFAQASLGDVYLERQEYQQALEAYEVSTKLAQEAGGRALVIYNLVKRGECFYQQQNLVKALNLAGQARALATETGLVVEQGLACALQAKIYVRRAEYGASFDLFATALACLSGNDVVEQAKARLWWGHSLLLDLRAAAALEQLQEAIRLALAMGELRQRLGPAAAETQRLLLYFLHREDTPAGIRDGIHLLLAQGQEPIDLAKPSLQVYAFGPPLLIVGGSRRRFTQRGGLSKAPEFLLYLLLHGQEGGCRWSDVSAAIWPDLEPERASTIFHQTLKRLRDVIFEAPDYIVRRDDYYQVNPAYLEWCDVLAFESLFERATKAAPETALPSQLELIAVCRGEFLAGFELGEWGEAYRASCEARFLQMVKLTGEQLLNAGSPQETLTVINKGLALDYFQEDLHRTALRAYARLGLYDHLAAHYAELCATFKAELGELPEPETQHLYQQLVAARQNTLMTPA